MTAQNLFIEVDENVCVFGFVGMSSTSFGAQWILGDPFIREYCNIYDIGTKQIGFAKARQE